MSYDRHEADQQIDNPVEEIGRGAKRVGNTALRKIRNRVINAGSKALGKVAIAFGKAIGATLVKLLPIFLIVVVILLIVIGMYYVVYEVRGMNQDYYISMGVQNEREIEYDKDGRGFYMKTTGLSEENRMVQEFYRHFGQNRSFWQIHGDEHHEEIIEGEAELISGEDPKAVRDYYNKESRFSVNPDFLFLMDELAYKGQFIYPEQFVEPVYHDIEKLELLQVADDEGVLVAKSTKYNDEGLKTSGKELGVWDYGFGSVFKYREDEIVHTVEGTWTGEDIFDPVLGEKVTVPLNEPFVYVMDGYPQKIWLMEKAVTFVGEFKFDYKDEKVQIGTLETGGKESKVNDPVNRVYKETYHHYEESCSTVTDPETGEKSEKCTKVYKGSYDLWKYREGAVYETKPVELPQPELTEEEREKREENRLKYLTDYAYFFESYVPESVKEGFDFYGRVGNLIHTDFDIGSLATMDNANFRNAMKYYPIVAKYGAMYGIEPEIIIAMIAQESGGNAGAGGGGLLQIVGTGKRCAQSSQHTFCVHNTADRQDPEKNIHWTMVYFLGKLEKYNGDVLKAIQSHNLDPAILFKPVEQGGRGLSPDSLEWLNPAHREWMRQHYGGSHTRSASTHCFPEGMSYNASGSIYGDACYLENVLRYYNGQMITSNGIDLNKLESGQEDSGLFDKILGFFGIKVEKYDEDEPRFLYKNRIYPSHIKTLLTGIKTFSQKLLFSEVDQFSDFAFWDEGFRDGRPGAPGGSGQALSREEFLNLVGDTGNYVPPLAIPNPRVTSPYGENRGSYIHKGIDIGVPIGTPLYAVYDGVVEIAVNDQLHSKQSWGNYVKLKLDDGNYVLYAHMNYVHVRAGQRVRAGDYLGDSGNSGRSFGPHLHFEFYYQSPDKSAITDPTHIVLQPHRFQ